ncbi:unnamed protein product [Linum tenue]|uniref:Uncharacterized protein n=1 Tax=Linum tenue TaxID=586396 RepID=A0AAV0RVT8_9ROSI|nr:unnamed protein product [Linum tenue]
MVTPLLSLLLLLSSPYKTAIAKSFSPSQLLPLQRFERKDNWNTLRVFVTKDCHLDYIAKDEPAMLYIAFVLFMRMIMTRHLTITEMVERARCLLTMDFCIQEHKYEQSKSNKLMEVSH